MATENRTHDQPWLSADELRKLAAVEPESGPPPPPVHRTDETRSRRPLGFGLAAALFAVLVIALIAI